MVAKSVNSSIGVLIIEDDKSACDVLSQKFEDEGFVVSTAENGKEGLVKFDEEAPDVILLDLYMPVMDGQTFLRELRKHPLGIKTPVVVLSNWIGHSSVINAFDSNVVDYLLKTNVNLETVVEKVTKASRINKNA